MEAHRMYRSSLNFTECMTRLKVRKCKMGSFIERRRKMCSQKTRSVDDHDLIWWSHLMVQWSSAKKNHNLHEKNFTWRPVIWLTGGTGATFSEFGFVTKFVKLIAERRKNIHFNSLWLFTRTIITGLDLKKDVNRMGTKVRILIIRRIQRN